MLPDRISNPGPLTYESGVLPIALRGPIDCATWCIHVSSIMSTVSTMPFLVNVNFEVNKIRGSLVS